MITGQPAVQTAAESVRLGAYDCVIKPIRKDNLLKITEAALKHKQLLDEKNLIQQEKNRYRRDLEAIFRSVRDAITTVDYEGKILAANAAVQQVCGVNRRELMGHSLEHISNPCLGRFEACPQGTIFLDEIGEVPPRLQVKLLRVLQDRCFERVGSNKPIDVDVRVISATNRDLKGEVAAGRFREDLYYRIKVVEISLPALRDRKTDIPLMARHFCHRMAKRYEKPVSGFTDQTLDALMHYDWPGNVRELEHAIEHAVVICPANVISRRYLPKEIRTPAMHPSAVGGPRSATEEFREIADVLRRTDGNKAKAARLLGISRQTLYRKLRRQP